MRGPQGIPAWDVLGASFRFRKKEVITTRRTPNPEDFWKFTDEEMETAKNTDLPDLLEHLGYCIWRAVDAKPGCYVLTPWLSSNWDIYLTRVSLLTPLL